MLRVILITFSIILPIFSMILSNTIEEGAEHFPTNLNAFERVKRSEAKSKEKYRWPNKTVPFYINMTYYKNSHAKQIFKAMKILEEKTCVKFVNRTDQEDFITFTGDTTHCTSKVGRRGGEQLVKLVNSTVGTQCFRVISVVHELMHTLGFYHAHKRSDRDKFLRINWENVLPGKKHKLEARTDADDLTDFGVGYDPHSIMHYSADAFSRNGLNTIEVIDKTKFGKGEMGQREKLSPKDILRIRRMYECDQNIQ